MDARKQTVLLGMAQSVAREVNAKIDACNRTKKVNYLFTSLVFFAQKECDLILAKADQPLLKRIEDCAKTVETLKAGNCLMQCFVAFNQLLKELILQKLSDPTINAVPLAIVTIKDHAFILINDDIICDPWASVVGIKRHDQVFENYFSIDASWMCKDGNVSDVASTQYTYEFCSNLLKTTPSIASSSTESKAVALSSMPITRESKMHFPSSKP